MIDDLPTVVGKAWHDLVECFRPPVKGFEAQFSWLRLQPGVHGALAEIERRIIEYFQALELPDAPTIYDYLVLGLRPKDTIATFNWDPLLLAAHIRSRHVADLPPVRFLHGCVSYFTCREHDVLGSVDEACPECYKPLLPTGLFFPESEKDYAKDAGIHREWQAVGEKLRRAFHLTIFGYSGPAADYRARKLLLDAWTESPMREVSHVEITMSPMMQLYVVAGGILSPFITIWSTVNSGTRRSRRFPAEPANTSCRHRFMEFQQNPLGRFVLTRCVSCRTGMPLLRGRNTVSPAKLRAPKRPRKPGRDYRDL